MKKLLVVLFITLTTTLQAKNYYISAAGNDTNDGLTTSTPWKTINKVNSFSFASSDYILFRRGDTFYGGIVVKNANLTYDAYGTGAKPVITGLSIVTGWVNLGGNIWEAPVVNVKPDVNLVLRAGLIQQVGRYPNSDAPNGGYLTYTAATSTSITGPALSSTTNWTGAEVAIRINRWEIRRQIVTSHSSGVVSFASNTSRNNKLPAGSSGSLPFAGLHRNPYLTPVCFRISALATIELSQPFGQPLTIPFSQLRQTN